jgi:hypothetical protein
MKDKAVISNDLVNDIFYKIPEIHIHHTVSASLRVSLRPWRENSFQAFLISLSQKLSQWDNKQTVGDLLLQMVNRFLSRGESTVFSLSLCCV